MAYRIQLNRGVQKNLRRIAGERLDVAARLATERPAGEADAVHRCRRACKALRALLRLVGPCCREAKRENRVLRDAAAALSSQRDAWVLRGVAEGLTRTIEDPRAAARAAVVVAAFDQRLAEAGAAGSTAERLDAFARTMREARGRAACWSVDAKGFAAIAPGLGRCYRDARRSMRRFAKARGQARDLALHEWRKRSKDHAYHLRWLRPLWPGPIKAAYREAARLNELLGELHDLIVLRETLEADAAAYGGPAMTEPLLRAAERRVAELEPRALDMGRRVFAEPTGRMTRRLERYWRAQAKRSKPPTQQRDVTPA